MTDGEAVPPPPEGFAAAAVRGPFSTHNGPYFYKLDEDGFQQAFFVLRRHCNSMGVVHGGMLATFLDGVLGASVWRAAGRAASVTVHLSVDYLSMARAGDWVIGEAQVTRQTRGLAFAEAQLRVNGRDIVRGSGVFKLMRRKVD